MKRNPFGAIALVATLSLVLAQPASAQWTVFDPYNYVKNTLTELNTLQTTINQVTQISNQLQQLAYQLQSLRNIPHGTWGQIQTDLAALSRVAKVGESISYADANLSSEFAQLYPGYVVPTNYTRAYTQWASNSLNGIQGALAVAGLQNSQLTSEDTVLAELEGLSDGSVGHMEALQVANMIGIQQAQQLQKLRELQMAQLQGEFDYLATQQQNDLSKFATLRSWLDSQTTYKASE